MPSSSSSTILPSPDRIWPLASLSSPSPPSPVILLLPGAVNSIMQGCYVAGPLVGVAISSLASSVRVCVKLQLLGPPGLLRSRNDLFWVFRWLGKTAVLLVAVLFVCVLTLVTLGPM